MTNLIPFFNLSCLHSEIRNEINQSIERVLNNSSFVLGDEVDQFEQEFATYCRAKYCISVGNGLDALTLTLRAKGIGEGDEVLVPSHTFIATWLAVSQCGAKPVPVDISMDNFLIDYEQISNKVTSKTKAIIPVHLYGHPVDVDLIHSFLPNEKKLFVLEDSAQAHGSRCKGKTAGTLGDASAFSFYPTKNLGCLGDGGAITTNDSELASKLYELRSYGSKEKYIHNSLGINSRLDEIQAAVLRIKLKRLDEWNRMRRQLAALYTQFLNGVGDIKVQAISEEVDHVFHLFVITSSKRDEIRRHLSNQGISALIHYPIAPIRQRAYSSIMSESYICPNADKASSTLLSLPLWPYMTEDALIRVANSIRKFFGEKAI